MFINRSVVFVWLILMLLLLLVRTCYFEIACGLAEQSRTHKRKVVSSSPVSANVFVSLGKILWVAVMGDVTI